VYVVVDGSLALRNHRAIRDALPADPHLARKYGDLKIRLAKSSRDVDTYVEGKTELLVAILADAGFTAAELARIRAANRPRGVSGPPGADMG
jgi:GrpB-like predicted nucleotidyltransferase (UPF0157 family)